MMKACGAVALLTIVAAPMAPCAQSVPPWGRLKACFDRNLPTLLSADEPSEVTFKAASTLCESVIDDAAEAIANDPAVRRAAGPGRLEPLVRRKIDAALFAYTVKFKASGGPTTMRP